MTRFTMASGLGCWLILGLLGAPDAAFAGGFYSTERGARAYSMGGAFVAGADDLNAQWMNPAGLTRLKSDWNLYLDMGLIFGERSFLRADDPEVMRKDPSLAAGFSEVSNEGGPFPDPSLGIATNFGLKDWMFSLGFYGPYAGTNKWDPNGAQRYSLHDLSALALFTQLSAAWKVNEMLRIGVGLQSVYVNIHQRLTISSYPGIFGWAEQRELDVVADVKASAASSLSGNVGVIVTPSAGFDIGLSLQLPVSVKSSGNVEIRNADHYFFQDVTVSGDAIDVALDFPMIARLGLRLFDDEKWSVELAAVWEGWSILDKISISPGEGGLAFDDVPGVGTYNVKGFDLIQNYEDVISIRLGGYLGIGDSLKLRGGAFFETGAPPDSTLSVMQIDADKVGGAIGATLELGTFTVDFTAGYSVFFERVVTDSIVAQTNPMYEVTPEGFDDDEPHIIGNGTYNGSTLVIAASLSAGF